MTKITTAALILETSEHGPDPQVQFLSDAGKEQMVSINITDEHGKTIFPEEYPSLSISQIKVLIPFLQSIVDVSSGK